MLLLRQLFDAAGGGPETDAFKHLSAAFTVLRSLGSAKTQANSESSRIVILVFIITHNNKLLLLLRLCGTHAITIIIINRVEFENIGPFHRGTGD